MRKGYSVWINREGQPFFETIGDTPSSIDLLGLQEYARQKIQTIVNEKNLAGDSLIHEIGKSVALLQDKVNNVTSLVVTLSKLAIDTLKIFGGK